MLYYKCTTNGGKMKVQKFSATALRSLLQHFEDNDTDLLIEARDKYLLTTDKLITLNCNTRSGFALTTSEVTLQDLDDHIRIVYRHNDRTIDFTIKPPSGINGDGLKIHKTTVLVESI